MAIFNSYVTNYHRVVLEVLKLSSLGFARGNSGRGLKVHRIIVMPWMGCPFSGTDKPCATCHGAGQGRFNNKTEQVKKALQYIFAKHLMCSWGMIL